MHFYVTARLAMRVIAYEREREREKEELGERMRVIHTCKPAQVHALKQLVISYKLVISYVPVLQTTSLHCIIIITQYFVQKILLSYGNLPQRELLADNKEAK